MATRLEDLDSLWYMDIIIKQCGRRKKDIIDAISNIQNLQNCETQHYIDKLNEMIYKYDDYIANTRRSE